MVGRASSSHIASMLPAKRMVGLPVGASGNRCPFSAGNLLVGFISTIEVVGQSIFRMSQFDQAYLHLVETEIRSLVSHHHDSIPFRNHRMPYTPHGKLTFVSSLSKVNFSRHEESTSTKATQLLQLAGQVLKFFRLLFQLTFLGKAPRTKSSSMTIGRRINKRRLEPSIWFHPTSVYIYIYVIHTIYYIYL